MAISAQVLMEDEYHYVAVTPPGGLAEHGAVCTLEIGRTQFAPEDHEALVLPISERGLAVLIQRLQIVMDRTRFARLH